MTTAADLIEETLDLLYGSTRQTLNTLAGAHDNSQTTFTFTYALDGISKGTLLCVDQEEMYVVDSSIPNQTATVLRGYRGSTAATHTSGSIASVNPKFSRYSIFRQMNHDLDDLTGMGLFQPQHVDLTYNAAIAGYDLTGVTDVIRILEVRSDTPGPDNVWPLLPPSKYALQRQSLAGDFTSGLGILMYQGSFPGMTIRVKYATSLGQFVDETSTVASVGLAQSARDLPPLGAALALLWPREVQRNFFEAQPDTRRPTEVPPGANLGAARQWAQVRQQRIATEIGNLNQDYPLVRR